METRKPRVALIFGTRPEAIKLAPVAFAFKELDQSIDLKIIVTGQHRQMLDQAMEIFNLRADVDLDIMKSGQTLTDITQRSLIALDQTFEEMSLDMVVVQGDTTTTFVGALAAFYRHIPVAHVEAGLRTNNKLSPFPEEVNRRLTGVIADLHFPPTTTSRDHLLKENVSPAAIEVTGNTSIDALHWVLKNRQPGLDRIFGVNYSAIGQGRIILMTSHRRENFGEPMRNAFHAIAGVIQSIQDVSLVFPVHMNPNVRREVEAVFKGMERVYLVEPLDYVNFAHLMRAAHVIVTDSGGVQEEAPTLGKPVVVLRDTTERPEGVAAGTACLVGTDADKIKNVLHGLLVDQKLYRKMAEATNPYGDGHAAGRVTRRIGAYLNAIKARN